MNILAYKYNRFLIFLLATSPFLSYFFATVLNTDFSRVFQLLSYIGVFLIFTFKDLRSTLTIPKYLVFYLLFTLYVFYSDFILLGRDFEIKYLFSNRLISALSIMFIIENFSISKKYYDFIFRLSKYILIIAFVVIVYQAGFDSGFLRNTINEAENTKFIPESEIRMKSIYSYNGYLSFGLGFLPILIWIIEGLYKDGKKVLVWIFMAIIYAFLSRARWLMVNVIFVFGVLIVNYENKTIQIFKYLFIFIFMISLSFIALNSVGIDTKKIVNERILESDKSNLSQKSAGTRILAFKAFNILFWEHPVFGVGNIKYGMGAAGKNDYKLRTVLGGHSSQIHVGHINMLYTYGIIGAFFFFTSLFLLLRNLYKTAKISKVWAPFFGILCFIFINFTHVTFSIFEMGLMIAIFVNKYQSQKIMDNKIIYA